MRTRRPVICFALAFVFLCVSPSIAQSPQSGYVKLIPDSNSVSPTGAAIISFRDTGILINETGVPPSTTVQSGRVLVEAGSGINTGIAFVNPTNDEASIAFYFTDTSGNDFGTGSFSVLPNHQFAAFFTDSPFGLSTPVSATFTFNSSSPITAVALRTVVNERGETLNTTMPVLPLRVPVFGNTLVFPAVSAGGITATEVVMINPGDTALAGTVQFFAQAANPTPVQVIADGIVRSSFGYSVPPHGTYRAVVQPANGGLQIGWMRVMLVEGNSLPWTFATISLRNAQQITVSSTTITALPPATLSRTYVESSGVFGSAQSAQSVITFQNPDLSPITIQLELKTMDGMPSGFTTSLTLGPGGLASKLLSDLFPQLPAPFRGGLKIYAPSPVFVTGIRGHYNERNDLLLITTPPYDDAATSPLQLYFPQILEGGGYSTQLVLLSTGPAHSGSAWVLSQDGLPLSGISLAPNP